MVTYKVNYLQPKKKKNFYIEQEVVFCDYESAAFYKNQILKRGSKDVKIIPVLNSL